MTATLVCTGCKKATTFSQSPVGVCGHCGEMFDREAVQAAEQSLRLERPLLVTVATWLSWFMLIPGLFMLLSFIPGCPGEFTVENKPVTQEEWTASGAPFLVPAVVLLLAVALGFTRRRVWARHAVMGLVLVPTVSSLLFPASRELFGVGSLVSCTFQFTAAVWYFYFKENVVDYYRALADHAQA